MCPKQGMEPCQKHLQAQRERQDYILLALRGMVLLAASTKEPEEREFVVDSEASMHMVSKKDLYSAELETMRTSRSPTTDDGNDGWPTARCKQEKKQRYMSKIWTYS